MKLKAFLALSAMVIAGDAAGQEAQFAPILSNGLRQGATLEQYLRQTMQPFRQAAGRDGILTREEVSVVETSRGTTTRMTMIAAFMELDTNDDGTVTVEEIAAARKRADGLHLRRFTESLQPSAEGVSILDVYRNASKSTPERSVPSPAAGYLVLGSGDQATAAQVLAKAVETFNAVDKDGDTVISTEEFAQVRQRIAKPQPQETFAVQENADCALPAPSETAETVLLGTYEGDALASVYVGDPHEETTTANIVVQPGKTPLYVVAASFEPQIWSVSGAVERIEKFVVAAPQAGERSGVVGLPKDRVAFGGAYGRPCIGYFYKSGTTETANARRAFHKAVGKEADRVGGAYSLSSISIPDMTLENLAPRSLRKVAPDGFDPATWRDALRFAPRGLVRFEPASVVSLTPAKSYEVLPQGIGLAQLVFSGHLERRGGVFRIAKPIAHFPAGLNGAHSVRFILGEGVPMPAGSPGHSCVTAEEGDNAILSPSSARCRDRRDANQANPDGTFR